MGLAVVLVVAATKPETFRIQRSIAIAAPPETVFMLIGNLHNWAPVGHAFSREV